MLGENSAAIRVDLAEGDGAHSSSLKAKAEPSNAGKQVEDTKGHCTFPFSTGGNSLATIQNSRPSMGAVALPSLRM